MKILIISILVGIAGFGLGYWGSNFSLYAGIPTAIFFFGLCYFILMRRSFAKLNTISQAAMERMQGIQSNPDPQGQLNLLDQTIIIFEPIWIPKSPPEASRRPPAPQEAAKSCKERQKSAQEGPKNAPRAPGSKERRRHRTARHKG